MQCPRLMADGGGARRLLPMPSVEIGSFLVLFLRSYWLSTQHCPAMLPGMCFGLAVGKLTLVGQSGNLDHTHRTLVRQLMREN